MNLGQLFKITPNFKIYLWQKLKLERSQNVYRVTIDKQVGFSILEVGTTIVPIDNHMAIIQVYIGKNTIEDVLLDGDFGVNILIE